MNQREFIKRAEKLSEAMAAEVIAAENLFVEKLAEPLPTRVYPNTNYWDKVGPMIEGYRIQQRRDQLELELDATVELIGAKYDALMQELEGLL